MNIGARLVCTDASKSDCLRVGQTYTCQAAEDEFVGVDCCSEHPPGHCGWFKRRFRPAVERKTSIEIFKKMLNPQGTDA